MNEPITKQDHQSAVSGLGETIITEMGIRFSEVNQHLDRIDATLVEHGKQLAGGARSRGLKRVGGKADADYTRVLAELRPEKSRHWAKIFCCAAALLFLGG